MINVKSLSFKSFVFRKLLSRPQENKKPAFSNSSRLISVDGRPDRRKEIKLRFQTEAPHNFQKKRVKLQ